jgi:hypothetical protein
MKRPVARHEVEANPSTWASGPHISAVWYMSKVWLAYLLRRAGADVTLHGSPLCRVFEFKKPRIFIFDL